MKVTAIMPCKGRSEQTVRNVKRLLAMAGAVEWVFTLVGTVADMQPLVSLLADGHVEIDAVAGQHLSYWRALDLATLKTDAPLLVGLANDLLPGKDWLQRGLNAYHARFGDGPGLMGFNDGIHGVDLSPHFIIHRDLLAHYGGWPVWYQHTHGDTELCLRAQADGCYGKAPWAVLYHDHVYTGGDDDDVYALGRAHIAEDQALFEQRRANGWTS